MCLRNHNERAMFDDNQRKNHLPKVLFTVRTSFVSGCNQTITKFYDLVIKHKSTYKESEKKTPQGSQGWKLMAYIFHNLYSDWPCKLQL